jgi:hypothetical protein
LYDVQARSDDMGEPRPLPEACPFILDDMLFVRPNVAALAAKLAVVV